MCGRTRFNPNETARQGCEELQQLRSGDALADHYRATSIHAVNLKNRLRDIETDLLTSPMDGSPQSGSFRRNHPMALRCRRVGAVHSIIRGRSMRYWQSDMSLCS
jgi:hypothetical protein